MATTAAGGPSAARRPNRSAAASAPETSAPQGLGWAVGSPVEPEVKAMAAIRPAGISGRRRGFVLSLGCGDVRPKHRQGGVHGTVGDHMRVRVAGGEGAEPLRRPVGGEQGDLPAGKGGGEAEQRAVAIGAEIDRIGAVGEAGREGGDLRQETADCDRPATPPAQHLRRRAGGEGEERVVGGAPAPVTVGAASRPAAGGSLGMAGGGVGEADGAEGPPQGGPSVVREARAAHDVFAEEQGGAEDGFHREHGGGTPSVRRAPRTARRRNRRGARPRAG